MAVKAIKEGDLVTISLGEYRVVSNTYRVARKIGSQCLLSHPLAPDIYILKNDTELNNNFPSLQNQVEKALVYAKQNTSALGYTMAADLEALIYFFIIKKEFTPSQRNDLANICGKIASMIINSNIGSAVTLIKQNKVLLDEYNHSLFNGVKHIIDDPLSMKHKGERYTIFNIAGFILAQSEK